MHTTWQLSVDWQMFTIAPLFAYLLWKFNGKCLGLLYAIIITSSINVFKTSFDNQFVIKDYDL